MFPVKQRKENFIPEMREVGLYYIMLLDTLVLMY